MTQRKAWFVGLAVVSVAVYVLMWVGCAQNWAWLGRVDNTILQALHGYGATRPGWVMSWNVFCTVLGPTAFRLIALVVIFIALKRCNVRLALFLVISVELSGLVTEAAKTAANRPRPAGAMVDASSTSFPSGHAVGVVVGVLALLTVAWPVIDARYRRWLAVLGAVLVVAIGVGRVVLNVHHPSDVVAGWALGYAWFVVCMLLVPPAVPITAADETPATHGSSR